MFAEGLIDHAMLGCVTNLDGGCNAGGACKSGAHTWHTDLYIHCLFSMRVRFQSLQRDIADIVLWLTVGPDLQ
jgi:hypothetical protein